MPKTMVLPAATPLAGEMTADISLVQFDVTLQHLEAVSRRHQRADLLPHAPSRLVRHAELALHFLAAHAMARRDEEIDRVEPQRQLRAAVFEDRSGAWVDMMTAGGTGESAATRDLVEGGFNAAFLAGVTHAVTHVHDVIQAGVIVGVARKEFADVEGGGCGRALAHEPKLESLRTCVKGINPFVKTTCAEIHFVEAYILLRLAADRAVEEDPDREIRREIQEAMLGVGCHEQCVAGRDRAGFALHQELA
jgi:hypothetical protein